MNARTTRAVTFTRAGSSQRQLVPAGTVIMVTAIFADRVTARLPDTFLTAEVGVDVVTLEGTGG
jgi:hypothetical protein